MTTPVTDAGLCAFLDSEGIAYRRFDHPAVFTCEEADRLVPREAVGVQTKNLFVRDKKGKRHWLLVTSCETAVDLKGLASRIGADNLSLASPDRLVRHLGVTPGSVTVLALLNDRDGQVTLLVDRALWEQTWRSHPLINTATLVLPWPSVDRFLAVSGHQPTVLDVPVREGPGRSTP
jgi:Ala-tRNA(Pro) deacylase